MGMTVGVERLTLIRAAMGFLAVGGLLGNASPAHAHAHADAHAHAQAHGHAHAPRRPAPGLRWTAPRQVDRGKTTIGLARGARRSRLAAVRSLSAAGGVTHGGIPITGISCPTASLCVVVDLNGNALTTATPDRPRSWKRFLIDGRAPLDAVSCSSPTFCAPVDTGGDVVTSTDPAGPAATKLAMSAHPAAVRPAWQTRRVDATNVMSASSCPTVRLCVAADTDGNVLTRRR